MKISRLGNARICIFVHINTVQLNDHIIFFPQDQFTISSQCNRKHVYHVFKARLQIQLAEEANIMCSASGSMPCVSDTLLQSYTSLKRRTYNE